ncbi:phosphoadenosine phosphosulfate reductase family protein [Ancylobacter polymorphus]|uniref:3'-phosphoadenosine 5'-phosphosulfate sulfotransferase (PAPS reductase)/FAD synthetase n=1 Tax=Ancylobacter polymorphus TaxID=223390 RepID=A0ABU0BJE8_9HYPH|nr:phosphoadenosine phosphosulfate reductase family protein [Ancylobacter polymorphus]MDQ0305441.1 3'-phosphoadenosine 5'-phosphosulfate sulfotransferase (PAPS reductase)/FAD synthetase [Ancylobacter polymorphus]
MGSERFIRFVIFASYGNDSCALIQWAHEWQLEGVAVVYSDTGWATKEWRQRVEEKEAWAQSLGFWTYRTESIGFPNLAREKKGFPTQRYQWCSFRLKIEPGMRWLDEHDPHKSAVCLVGARRDEAKSPEDSRAKFPEYLVRSDNHGGRLMLAPFVCWDATARDELLHRAGIEPLPHRSRECRCINSNKSDMRLWTEDDIAEMRALEAEIGKPIFRPARHMGAKGIDEVVRWANSPRGKYGAEVEEDLFGCSTGWCEA